MAEPAENNRYPRTKRSPFTGSPGSRPRGSGLTIALFVCLIVTAFYQVHIYNTRKKPDFLRARIMMIPRAEILRSFSLGYDHLIVDMLWIQGIQYYAQQFSQLRRPVSEGEPPRGEALVGVFETMTVLNPAFRPGYSFGAFILGDSMHDPDAEIPTHEERVRWLREQGGPRYYPGRSGAERAIDEFLIPGRVQFPLDPDIAKEAGFMAMQLLDDPPYAAALFTYAATSARELLTNQLTTIFSQDRELRKPAEAALAVIDRGIPDDDIVRLVRRYYHHWSLSRQEELITNLQSNRSVWEWLSRMPTVVLTRSGQWLGIAEQNLLQEIRTALNEGQRAIITSHLMRTIQSIQMQDLREDIDRFIEEKGEKPASIRDVLRAGLLRERQMYTLEDILRLRIQVGDRLDTLPPEFRNMVLAPETFERIRGRRPEFLAELMNENLFYPDLLYDPGSNRGLPHRRAERMPSNPFGEEYVYVPVYDTIGLRSELDMQQAQMIYFLNLKIVEYTNDHGAPPNSLEDLVGDYIVPETLRDPYGASFSLDSFTNTVQIEVPAE